MAAKRYWAYSRDSEGDELVENIDDCDDLRDAIDGAVWYLVRLYPHTSGVTVHVVDNESGATVWIAGPGNTITSPPSWTVMDEVVGRV